VQGLEFKPKYCQNNNNNNKNWYHTTILFYKDCSLHLALDHERFQWVGFSDAWVSQPLLAGDPNLTPME
jgi:hypothetical protein